MTPSEAAAVLGVRPDASIPEVQHAFVSASRRLHPDLQPDATAEARHEAGHRFALAREARDVLIAEHPVVAVSYSPSMLPGRRRGIGRSVVVLLLLAAALVASVTLADSYRSQTVENLRGGVVESP